MARRYFASYACQPFVSGEHVPLSITRACATGDRDAEHPPSSRIMLPPRRLADRVVADSADDRVLRRRDRDRDPDAGDDERRQQLRCAGTGAGLACLSTTVERSC